jgi:hypothetical protein
MAKRKFKVTTIDGSFFLNPINDDELIYNWKLKKDSILYDLTLTTKLIFVKDDFNFLVAFANDISKRCELITCEIYKNCSGVDVLEHVGIMQILTGEWDIDRCTVKIALETDSTLKDKIENQKANTLIPVAQITSYLNAGPDAAATYAFTDYGVPSGGLFFAVSGPLYKLFNWTTGAEVGAIGDVVYVGTLSGGYFTYFSDGYWRRQHLYNTTYSAGGYYLYDYDVSGNPTYIMPKKLNIKGLFFNDRADAYSGGTDFQLPYQSFGMLCFWIVRELLSNCGRDYTLLEHLRSDFFDWNPKGDTAGYVASIIPKLDLTMGVTKYPDSVGGITTNRERSMLLPRIPGTNYVTGQPNKLTHLLFMPKSNSNNSFADTWENQTIASDDGSGGYIYNTNSNKLTFEDIELIWATVFNAYWFIDTDGCMRVEHISWFNNNAHLYDSTNALNNHLNIANRKFKFSKDKLSNKEIFLFSANRDRLNGNVDTGFDNQNNEIFYESICLNNKSKDEKTYSVSKVTTDITGIDSANNSFSAEFYDTKGIFLCTIDLAAPTFIVPHASNPYNQGVTVATCQSETLKNTSDLITYENGHLQWANLIRTYLLDKRILPIGKNGLEYINFTARTVKTKEQENIKLIQCCDAEAFDPTQGTIRTELGDGIIEEAEYNTKTNIIKIKALHD